jgi:hypothetical protein
MMSLSPIVFGGQLSIGERRESCLDEIQEGGRSVKGVRVWTTPTGRHSNAWEGYFRTVGERGFEQKRGGALGLGQHGHHPLDLRAGSAYTKNFDYKNFGEFGSLCEPLQAGLPSRTIGGYSCAPAPDYRPARY